MCRSTRVVQNREIRLPSSPVLHMQTIQLFFFFFLIMALQFIFTFFFFSPDGMDVVPAVPGQFEDADVDH